MESIYKNLLNKAVHKNKFKSLEVSLNDIVNNSNNSNNTNYDNDNNTELINLIADPNSINPFEEYEHINKFETLNKILSQLPIQLKQICNLFLQDKNITEISKELNLSRKTIYQKINKIKEIFKQEGLHE